MRSRISVIAVTVACIAGIIHAASSVYWALGGRWLLSTVGEWAVDAVETTPLAVSIALGVIGLVKFLAATIPVALAARKIPWPRFWRTVCWVGASTILVYGGANVLVSGAVLLGVITSDGGYDQNAMLGHVLLWDPLFVIWGASLIVWLRLSVATVDR